jgi:hypothetical protein
MALIGFVLLAVAGALGIDIAVRNRYDLEVDVYGQVIATSASGLFVAGIVTGLVAAVAIMLVRDGLRHEGRWPDGTLTRRRQLARDAKQAHVELDDEPARPDVDDREPVDLRDPARATTL